ncbi:MAG: hypothetical protein DWP95_03845 [Proteobacteria bacterium]|nr:MAG: hypothetical protein DWP95_03845 [Pseudomonadota bacterium]
MKLKLFITLWLVLLFPSANAWVSVGSSPGYGTCTYTSIQQALNAGASEIRVLNNQDFVENLVIDYAVDVKGGYSSCLSATLNLTENTKTVIKGSASLGSSVVTIDTINNPIVSLSKLVLQDATDTIFVVNGGHGIDIGDSNGLIEITDLEITNNHSDNGGGIYVGATVGGTLQLVITDTLINQNSANNRGGGIFCAEDDTIIRVSGNSLITENNAEEGGGIAALNGCRVTVDSGSSLTPNAGSRGILDNSASLRGGGIYLNSAAQLWLQGNKYGFNIFGNNVDPVTVSNNKTQGEGGGIYAANSSSIEIIEGFISSNWAFGGHGGAIFLDSSTTTPVTLSMKTSGKKCWHPSRCSILSGNHASDYGGAIFMKGGADVEIENTYIMGNFADFGTAVYVSGLGGSGASASIESSYLYGNGSNGGDSTYDYYMIRGNGDVSINLLHNTIADNDVNNTRAVIGINDSSLTIKNTIFRNVGETVLESSGTNFTEFSCLISNENSSIPANVIDPEFIDEVNHNYHLSSLSPAIDLCTIVSAVTLDADNDIRAWDDPTAYNNGVNYIYDAGADESYINDIIFKNSFH